MTWDLLKDALLTELQRRGKTNIGLTHSLNMDAWLGSGEVYYSPSLQVLSLNSSPKFSGWPRSW